MKILRALHIGVSNRGEWPLRLATPERGFSPVALCDPNRQALAAAAKISGLSGAACFSDLEEALAKAEADCAIICAPTHLHVPLVKRCVEARLSVLVEKGMAPSWKDACDLVGFITKHGAKVAVSQNYRYQAPERAIFGLLGNSEAPLAIGNPFLIIYEQLRVRPVPANLTYPFASIWDVSCHHFDTLLYWLGPVQSAVAQAWGAPWSAYEHPSNTSAHLVFQNGTHVHYFHGHDCARSSQRVELHGDKGAVAWTDAGLAASRRPMQNFGSSPDMPIPLEPVSGEAGVLRDFYRYVADGVEPGISARQNLEVMALCQMMTLSIQQEKTVMREELAEAAACL